MRMVMKFALQDEGPDESRGHMTTAVQERRDCVATARSLMDRMLSDDEESTLMMRNHYR